VFSTAHSWGGVQTFTNPVVGTQTPGDNTTKAASTAFVQAAVTAATAGVASIDTANGAITISGLITRSSQDLRVTAASKSDQETGTSTTSVVTPANFKNSDSAVKAWCVFNGTTVGTNACDASFNVTSVTRFGAGTYTVNFATAFASTSYACTAMGATTSNAMVYGNSAAQTTSTFGLYSVVSTTNAVVDPVRVHIACYGRQ
jgi:hypothetical protein